MNARASFGSSVFFIHITMKKIWQEHSLSIIAATILVTWIILFSRADDQTHWGSFLGNAIADWTGVLAIILATKFMYERNSDESNNPPEEPENYPAWKRFFHEHSLSIFFILTGICWLIAFMQMDPTSKGGAIISNIVSEWVQIVGLILLTKKFFEIRSKE